MRLTGDILAGPGFYKQKKLNANIINLSIKSLLSLLQHIQIYEWFFSKHLFFICFTGDLSQFILFELR